MELNEPLYNAIYFLEKSNEIINQRCEDNIDELSQHTPWPSMHDMYKRNYEYCCGVVSVFLIGQFTSSEALCRTAIEGAVNLHYVSLGDSMDKQISYFKSYIQTERSQNIKWKEAVNNSDHPQTAKGEHYGRIIDKDSVLDLYEKTLKQSLALNGVDYDASNIRWPNIFDRFREIGKEVAYRTVYAALCSQTHNDAEDVLNSIMARIIEGVDGLEEAQFIEQYTFSLYLMLTAIEFHVSASAMYLAKFNIDVAELAEIQKSLIETTVNATEHSAQLIKNKIGNKST
jgi:hypothetical protein